MNIKHTESFDLAYRFVTETNLNIFLTGKAGTGKTTFLKYLRENSFKKMAVAAPTGVAAINAGGVTLHSLFQLPFAPFIPSNDSSENHFERNEENKNFVSSKSLLSQIRFNKEKINLLRNLELLVIDEASMVASHTVDAIDTLMRSVRRRRQQAFGGVQVLFIGDLYQLPPVVRNHEWSILKNYYASPFFFDSLVLRENIPVMIELKEIFRQRDDSFIEVLNGIRNNNLTENNFSLLNSRLKRNFLPEDEDGYITLTTHNVQSDDINKNKLRKLNSRSQIYDAEIRRDFPEHLFPVELKLELKLGAQVMFLKNDTEEKKYFNGKIGIITTLEKDLIKVKCKDDSYEIVVKKEEWKNINYSLDPVTHEISELELGSYIQYPLRLAWAITIHKSQGLTFDKLIIDSEKAFANGQVYVALSRCTSLEGLVLTSPINREFLGANKNLKDWQEKNHNEKNIEDKFKESRQKFILQELLDVFTFKNWYSELTELNEILTDEQENLPAESLPWIKKLFEEQKTIYEVSVKFRELLIGLSKENSVVEENQSLQSRVKDAANYFSAGITKWKELFFNHPLSTDTKKVSRKTDGALSEINILVDEILHKINFCKNGFLLNEYLRSGKKFQGVQNKIQGSYAQNQIKSISSSELEHARLYDRISEMRRKIAGETNAPLYLIFNNAAIKNVCVNLPADKNSLLKVNGFGKVKVEKYGDEVIEIVNSYCNEKNIKPQTILASTKLRKERGEKKSNTVEETLNHFRQGKNAKAIAIARNLSEGTIEGHFAQAIKLGSVDIKEFMEMDEVKKIAAHFPTDAEFVSVNFVKQKLPDVSYGKLRMVLAWLQKEKQTA